MASRNVPDVPRQLLARFDLASQIHSEYEKIKNQARSDILALMGEGRTYSGDGWTAMQLPRERKHFLQRAIPHGPSPNLYRLSDFSVVCRSSR